MSGGDRLHPYLLPLACGLAAAMLAASQFMTLFNIDVEGTIVQHAHPGTGHAVPMVAFAVLALAAMAAALLTGARTLAFTVAVVGAAALAVVLLADVPDVNRRGTLPNFVTGKAEPGPGFWFELIGSAMLALTGAALATMRPEQLEELGGGQPSPASEAEGAVNLGAAKTEPEQDAGRSAKRAYSERT